MNGSEQKTHKTVTEALAKRIGDLEVIVMALDHQVATAAGATLASVREERAAREQLGAELRGAIGQERTHRLQLADQQRAYVDAADRAIRQTIDILARSTLWQRLRWLFRGT